MLAIQNSENYDAEIEADSEAYLAKIIEEMTLRIGYCLMLRERAPFNSSAENCSSEESAFFLWLENEFIMNMPKEDESYENIAPDIEEQYKPLIKTTWASLLQKQSAFQRNSQHLQKTWRRPPILPMEKFRETGKRAREIVRKYPIPVPKEHKTNIALTITPPFEALGKLSRLSNWQEGERSTRGKFAEDHQELMVALRIYREMLLEENQDKTKSVLPKDHPLRQEIQKRHERARIINTAYQCIQVAKGVHNEQKKGRLRKHEGIPYAMHALRVTMATLMDTFPFWDDENKSIDPILLAAVAPMHDTAEDTEETISNIMNLMSSRTDSYDTSIKLSSNFPFQGGGDTIEMLRTNKVNLVQNPEMLGKIRNLLRILTNQDDETDFAEKAPLSKEEMAKAVEQNLFGEEQTLLHLGLLSKEDLELSEDEKQKKIISIKRSLGIPPLLTFITKLQKSNTGNSFPEDHGGGKLTKFLIRAKAISACHSDDEKEQQSLLQHALIIKFEDRANNLITKPSDEEKHVKSKRKSLRNTFERLIAYAIYDHDNSKYPLCNALPRLIHTTLKVYKELSKTHPEMIEDIDREYMEKLEIFAKGETEITRFRINEEVQSIMSDFAEKRKNKKPTRGSIYEFISNSQ